MKLNKKGFTIVELVIVIAVIAILAAVLIPTFNSVINKANESAALQEARAAETVLIAKLKGNLDTAYYFVSGDGKYVHKYTKDEGLKLDGTAVYTAGTPAKLKIDGVEYTVGGAAVDNKTLKQVEFDDDDEKKDIGKVTVYYLETKTA